MRSRYRLAACLVLVASAGMAVAAGGGDPRGTYRMEGAAHVRAPPAIQRTVEVHADAVLGAGGRAGYVRVRLVSAGQSCELGARLDATGDLAFPGDQVCPIEIQSPDARGHVEARLRGGRGRVEADRLDLSLSCKLDGAVRLRPALGGGVELPALWMQVPVHGDAEVAIQGGQDHSRAAAP